MKGYSVFFPGYSIGEEAYGEISAVCAPFGKTAVVIGGKTAMEKARPYLIAATEDSGIDITDFIWYRGEAAYEYAEELATLSAIQKADMLFGVGGGKAIDLAKLVADRLNKPFFTFPTIASTCAAISALGVYYTKEHTFKDITRAKRPPLHVFISTRVIAEAPELYLWAGIGDGMSKETEVTFSAREREAELTLSDAAGAALSGCCTAPFLQYGVQAMEDCKKNQPSPAIEAIALNILINTGMVSNMVDSVKYNTSLGHAIFNSMTKLPQIEARHLHGEVVSYGTLVLLMLDGQLDRLAVFYDFYRKMKLPTRLSDIEVSVDELEPVLDEILTKYDVETAPYPLTKENIRAAILSLEEWNDKRVLS